MSKVPEEPDIESVALIEKLRSAPERDPQAAANGKSKFLAQAREYEVSVSARREQRHMGWKENPMRLARVPVFLLLIVVIGLVVVFVSGQTMLRSRSPQSPALSNVGVFVAGQNIPQGASITEDELATITLPQDTVSAVEFTTDKKAQLVGKVAKYPLAQGTVITSAMVGESPAIAIAGPQWAAPNPQSGLHFGATQQPTLSAGAILPQSGGYLNQMVIKNGDIRLQVKDTDRALDGVTQIVTDTQGYVISSRVWYQDYSGTNYKYATLTMGVPVDQFESAERRLRSLAVRILDETTSGQDVTNQYVDLESQLTNLEATRDRIKSFLDQATSVDEALRVNQQLSEVEGQIEQIKGQMHYLSNRSAFSTITINLEPELPTNVATQTPTPTATPTASLGAWNAGDTTRQATFTLVSAYRLIADFLIWLFLVIVPVFGPPAALIWLVVWLIRRRRNAVGKGQGTPGLPTNR